VINTKNIVEKDVRLRLI